MHYFVGVHPTTHAVQQLSSLAGDDVPESLHEITQEEYAAADAVGGSGLTFNPATGVWGGL